MTSRSKNLDFFDQLFHEYYGALLAYTNKIVSNKNAAEDIVQDVFMNMWVKKDDIDFTAPISPYLYKAVHHKSLNFLQKESYTKPLDEPVDILIRQEMAEYDAMDIILYKEMVKEIRNCTDKFPPGCKKVFMLSRTKNLKNKEIAELLGISEKMIEKQISKALGLLRAHLKAVGLISLLNVLFSFWK